MKTRIVGISGSLRTGSYNTAALSAAKSVAPADCEVEILTLKGIPVYDPDLESDQPESVRAMVQSLANADGVLIATPEYNYSVPGGLKNAIDWLSRDASKPLDGRPLGIIGASPGMLGSGRAQYHLRQSMVFLNMHVMNKPEVMIASAHEKFDANGNLIHEPTREFLGKFMSAFVEWVGRFPR
ncbi:MAG TPA: NADPH-dependent FMN reductase [Fimbriimonadaceae bacterium]|nr:NADPH-dependent FMN reductase [Fimbriimonadaceae bacterium]